MPAKGHLLTPGTVWRCQLRATSELMHRSKIAPRCAARQRRRHDEAVGGFKTDDQLSVRSLLLFDDGTPACRSFAS